jgi:hypothetical protein
MRAYASISLLVVMWAFPALADSRQCTVAKDKGNAAASEYYDPRIKQVDDAIRDIKDKGGNPDDIAIRVGDKFLTFPEIRAKLAKDKQIALAAVTTQIDECEKGMKPYQDLVNEYANLATGGVLKMLPGKMGFIDVSDILAGYPLGGPDAFVPKAREQILKALGMGGKNNTAGKIFRDPIKEGIIRPIQCIFGCK